MRSLILCAAIAISICNSQYVDDFNIFSSNSDCTKSGMYCLNATVRINCQEDSNGNFFNLGEYDCSLDKQLCCNGLCQDPTMPCSSSDLKFQCSQTGTFPDLLDCKKYYVCNGFKLDHSANCVCQSFDFKMGLCGTDATSCSTCPSNTADCRKPIDIGLLKPYPSMEGDPTNFFYICTSSTAYTMGKCPDEETVMDNMCIPVCSTDNKGPFADPNDCHSFFLCNDDNKLTSMKCPEGQGYANKSCIPLPSEKLPTCESNGTSSPSDSTSSTTESTSSSSMPSTPTTSTTSTTGSPESPFQCEIPGNYSDSSNCHRYITCSSSLKATYNDCGSDYVYSPFYRQCVIGIC